MFILTRIYTISAIITYNAIFTTEQTYELIMMMILFVFKLRCVQFGVSVKVTMFLSCSAQPRLDGLHDHMFCWFGKL